VPLKKPNCPAVPRFSSRSRKIQSLPDESYLAQWLPKREDNHANKPLIVSVIEIVFIKTLRSRIPQSASHAKAPADTTFSNHAFQQAKNSKFFFTKNALILHQTRILSVQ
jgi:hypothetical protein